VKDWDRNDLIREAVDQTPGVPPRLAKQVTFWAEEFAWMKGRSLRTLAAYLSAKRTSRATAIRVTAEDRRAVFAVFTAYERLLSRRRACDWDDLAHLLLRHKHRIHRQFYALNTLVDEGQDLSAAEFDAIRALSVKSLTIAADPAQKIYKTGFRWSDIGIGAVGRTKTLPRAFRCSRPVAELAMSLKRHQPKFTDADEMPAEWLEFDKRDGPLPIVWKAATPTAKDQVLRRQVHSLIESNPNDIVAVLCPTKKLVEKAAKTIGPRARLLRDDFDFATPGVLVSTIHSAKGLEFHHVAICGLENGVLPRKPVEDGEPDPESDLAVARQLLYVGMTRALKTLQLITGPGPCRFIELVLA
jgi:superfamily I DNA/RNA helicase